MALRMRTSKHSFGGVHSFKITFLSEFVWKAFSFPRVAGCVVSAYILGTLTAAVSGFREHVS